MQSIENVIKQATEAPVGTVVHVGAGRGAVLDQYARLALSTVVLVEGDPETASALQRAARPFAWARVIARAAAASDGELTWNRYNLPVLNGPLAVDALVRSYPRLNRETTSSVPGVALASLLRSALDDAEAGKASVLVLDVPGQEAVLLDSIGDQLHRMSGVVIRRCAMPLPGAEPWPAVVERMRARSFELVGHEADGEPLWPVAYFRFDGRRHEEWLLRTEVERLKRRQGLFERDFEQAKIAAKKAESDHADEVAALAQAKAAAEKVVAEREVTVAQLVKARDEQAQQVAALTQAKAAAEKVVAEREATVAQLVKARDEQAKQAAEQAQQVAALTQAKAAAEKVAAEREVTVAQLTQARDEQAKQAAEQAQQVAALTQAKAAAEKVAAEREATVAQLTQVRDEQAQQVLALTQAKAATETLVAEREVTVAQLTQARDEQAQQVAALTQAKAATEKAAAERDATVAQLTQVRDEQAQQVTALTQAKAATETLVAEREVTVVQLTQARDEQAQQVAALTQAKAAAEKAAAERGVELQRIATRNSELEKACEVTRTEASAAQARLAEAQNSLSQAVRARFVSDNDLRELQGRFRRLRGERDELVELLGVLEARLVRASEHYARATGSLSQGQDHVAPGPNGVCTDRAAVVRNRRRGVSAAASADER